MDKIINSKDKHLLIIGGTGFIGKNLSKNAIIRGMKVTSLSLNKNEDFSDVNGVNYLYCDVLDHLKLKEIFKIDYDYIVNLSGYVDHSNFYKGGIDVIKSHFYGLINILNYINFSKCKKFINIGSSDEYGESLSPQDESIFPKPNTSYAFSKYAGTSLLQYLFRSENIPVAIVRLFLVYGPDQNKERFLPQIIRGCYSKAPFPVSLGEQIRDFCFIDDVIDAIFLILLSPKSNGEIFNIGSGIPIKIKDLVDLVRHKIGYGKPEFGKLPYKINEIMSLYADISKLKKILGWTPNVSLDEGITKTIESFPDNELQT